MKDYYAILGVAPGSEDIVITAAYRALMRRYHPDTNSDPKAATKAQEINAAYAVLSDTQRRAEYDRSRAGSAKESQSQTRPNHSNNQRSPDPEKDKPSAPLSKQGNNNFKWQGWLVAVLIIGSLIAMTRLPTSKSTDLNSLYVDETLTTENVTASDIAAIDSQLNSVAANAGVTDIGYLGGATPMVGGSDGSVSNELTVEPTPSVSSLSSQNQTALTYEDVESAARKFADILINKGGMRGARAYSQSCHKALAQSPTWSKADFCAAFDSSAAQLDAEITKNSGSPVNGYFQFQQDNLAATYTSVGAPSYLLSDRLSSLNKTARRVVGEAVSTEIEKSERRPTRSKAQNENANADAG